MKSMREPKVVVKALVAHEDASGLWITMVALVALYTVVVL